MIRTITAHITASARKLWSCREMCRRQGQFKGALPKNAGQVIKLKEPPIKSPFCQGKAWRVQPDQILKHSSSPVSGALVCEHQIDFRPVLVTDRKERSR
jgi:hypothetical protein